MHEHRWRKVFEEDLFGGTSHIGWECVDCEKHIPNGPIAPEGLGGTILKKSAHLYAPCGGSGETPSGKPYREQIIDEDGKLTIIE